MQVSSAVRRVWSVVLAMAVAAAVVVGMEATPAAAISNNNAVVTNSITALSAQPCTGRTKIDSCIKMRGSLSVVAGIGTPSLYNIDELAFIRDSGTVGGVTPASFTSNGVPSHGANPVHSTALGCYVLDVDAVSAGPLTYTCEMSSLACNTLYRYHLAGSHTTAGLVEHSTINTTATSIYAYTTPCAPPAATVTGLGSNATLTVAVPKGALAQTIGLVYGTDTNYGSTALPTGSPVTAGGGTSNVTFALTGLTCGTEYHYRLSSTTDDGAANGSVTVNSIDRTFTPTCPVAPTLAPISDVTVPSSEFACSAQVDPPTVTATGLPDPNVTFSPDMPGSFPVGTTSVTATASNGTNPDATRTFNVTVEDTTDPLLAARPGINVEATAASGAIVTFAGSIASDNCPGVNTTLTPPSGSLFPVGTTTVTERATDVAGNFTELTFEVTVTFRPIYFVVGQTSPLTAPDAAVRTRLAATGRPVVLVDDDTVTAAGVNGGALVVLSSSVVTTKVGAKLADITSPLITWEGYLHDENKLGTTGDETPTTSATITITRPAHPLAAGYTGRPTVMTSASKLSYATVPATATVIATQPNFTNRAVLFAYSTGDQRADGSNSPSCRVGFFPDYLGAGKLNTAGRKLLDAAITWSLNCPKPA